MKKIILDFSIPENKKELHRYLAEELDFPDHYGNNLDALYDLLTEISEPTAIGFFLPSADPDDLNIDLLVYIDKVQRVFRDAERMNPSIAVIYGDVMDNFGAFDEPFGPEDEDLSLDEYFK